VGRGLGADPRSEPALEPGAVSATADGARSPLLEFRHVTKTFPGQIAVDDVSFSVWPGEIHALVGENGAGKTTLIKVLAGEHHADAGEIVLAGEPLRVRYPGEATAHGIGFIHQEPALVPSLSVAENVTLGLGFVNTGGLINWRAHRRMARSALQRVGLELDPGEPLSGLGVAERQLVAVARVMLMRNRRLVVFDEVTAPLTEVEVERLFRIIRGMRDEGVGVVYVSHRLEEIFELGDRVTVLRNGAWIATTDVASLDQRALVRLIIGHEPAERSADTAPTSGRRPAVSLRGICDATLKDVSFDAYPGEIVGLAGLTGSGRTNVLEVLFGARAPTAGTIELDGEPVKLRHPADAIKRGVAMVTEERKRDGLVPSFPIWQTITLPWLRRFSVAGFLHLQRERRAAHEAARRFDVRARSVRTPVRELSGGNQQKVLLARWLSQSVRVLLLDEPTHGVDVGARDEIMGMIRRIAAGGVCVIVVSSELAELEQLCSRVLLLVEGRLIGELTGTNVKKPRMLDALYSYRIRSWTTG
jgi:ABC-type sugar transport system ATPase subunit